MPLEKGVIRGRSNVPSVLARAVNKKINHQGRRKITHPLKYIFSLEKKVRRCANMIPKTPVDPARTIKAYICSIKLNGGTRPNIRIADQSESLRVEKFIE